VRHTPPDLIAMIILTENSGICYLQNLPFARYRAQQRREQIVLHHLQLLWIKTKCYCYQDWFLCSSRKEKKTTGLDGFIMLRYASRGRSARENYCGQICFWLETLLFAHLHTVSMVFDVHIGISYELMA
jgi:hypothetical protein